ncbi:hypothetical protein JM93_03251 [Roseibium hamelinense]|uniref:DUF1674 domain-containing protein n=1 Tax=Roseibium hamelinense TaxID=150831 RepID=A0A562SN53_9HYPH|nr:DUF1674 domain-containing protein [Roseibium hamelinense]MTI44055.1 DUF1674 domain-containing protein [Roseibium hamelinense]TWI82737.1 hypothetical protein JM93_03251 [Roseibium hamelinense]
MDDKKPQTTETYEALDVPNLASKADGVAAKRFEDLPPAAQRALLEAQERRKKIDEKNNAMPMEIDGRGGLEPTRYDDWEIKGITVDF